MKLLCVENEWIEEVLSMSHKLKEYTRIAAGITKGKTYQAFAVPVVPYSGLGVSCISLYDIQFLIFNDNGEWVCYRKSFFEPGEDK